MMGYFGGGAEGMDVDTVPLRNLYPAAQGGTIATMGSASSPDVLGNIDPTGPAVTTPVVSTGVGGRPLAWWMGMALLVALILWTARKTGDAGEFSNLRASTYNITLITLVSILGITVMKIIAVKMARVPGLSGLSSVIIAA